LRSSIILVAEEDLGRQTVPSIDRRFELVGPDEVEGRTGGHDPHFVADAPERCEQLRRLDSGDRAGDTEDQPGHGGLAVRIGTTAG
jgi:hypothetical protein